MSSQPILKEFLELGFEIKAATHYAEYKYLYLQKGSEAFAFELQNNRISDGSTALHKIIG